jgi:riboflavin synthase
VFTGIVEETGTIISAEAGKLTVKAKIISDGIKAGDSVAVNGVCLTAAEIKKQSISFDIMPETVRRTGINFLHYGDHVNLERALPAQGRFGGHFVQGHVDNIGKIISLKPEGNAVIMKISAEPAVMKYIVEKGFIAVDGVSLTVTGIDRFAFSVSLVESTRKQTTLGMMKPGSRVNLEVDILAKYIERFSRVDSNKAVIDFIEDYDLSKMG